MVIIFKKMKVCQYTLIPREQHSLFKFYSAKRDFYFLTFSHLFSQKKITPL